MSVQVLSAGFDVNTVIGKRVGGSFQGVLTVILGDVDSKYA